MLDLNTGFPDLDVVPRAHLAEIMAEAATQPEAQQYTGSALGLASTRAHLANFLTGQLGATVTPDALLIPHGALGGIDLTARTLLKPGRGDIALVEDPTFFFAIHIFHNNGAEVVGVPMTPDGLDTAVLRATLERLRGRVRLLYTIPAYHNPTGACLSAARRETLVALAREYDFVILEDATYQALYFDAPPPPVVRLYDDGGAGDRIITLGSFSKLIMPSLRQGWLWASEAQIRAMARSKTDGASGALTSYALGEFLKAGLMDAQIEVVRRLYARKRDVMAAALARQMPDWVRWEAPGGGFFFWLTLPRELHATELRTMANAAGVDFMPGRECHVDGATDHHLRLCFAYRPEAELEAGAAALGACLREFAARA
jgi:DNA-binding transcriptional MocR family regulator